MLGGVVLIAAVLIEFLSAAFVYWQRLWKERVIHCECKAYTLSDQKSVLAPAKRHTGGLNGAFLFFGSSYLPDLESECAAPGWICVQRGMVEFRARLGVVAD